MDQLDFLVISLIKEANIDFIDLPFIASKVEQAGKSIDFREVVENGLSVIRELMSRDVSPGDYDYGESSFHFWSGRPEEQLDRIKSEWMASGKKPNLGDPICWFALRPPNLAEGSFWIMGKWVEP